MFLTVPAFASEKAVTVQGGWIHTPSSAYGDDLSLSARVEQMLYKDLSLGAEYEYHGPTDHYSDDSEGNRFTYGAFKGHSLLGELIYYPRLNWSAKPYILGGLGWSWWDFELSNASKDAGYKVDLGSSFAKKVAVGLSYPINQKWSFNLEWSYFQSHVPKDSEPYNILGDDDRSGRTRIGQEETSLLAGIKFHF